MQPLYQDRLTEDLFGRKNVLSPDFWQEKKGIEDFKVEDYLALKMLGIL